MIDVFAMAAILVDDVKRRYADDIAIVAYYGSYVYGTADERSDLDMFFIPATPRGAAASLQFVIGGIGCDFWPISWERAERIASFDEEIVAVIADAKVLLARTDADRARFEALRDRIRALCRPENRRLMVSKALAHLEKCFVHLHAMGSPSCHDDFASTAIAAAKVVRIVLHSLALANQTYYTRGPGANLAQVRTFGRKPDGIEERLERITESRDAAQIRRTCDDLVAGMTELLFATQAAFPVAGSYPDVCAGFYEEIRSLLTKVERACREGDRATAWFTALAVQDEVSTLLARATSGIDVAAIAAYAGYRSAWDRAGFPDIASVAASGDPASLCACIVDVDSRLRRHLEEHGVDLKIFHGLDDFRAFLERT